MSIKKLRHQHGPEGRQQHKEEMAARLAPLEEIHAAEHPQAAADNGAGGNGDGAYHDGSITVDRRSVRLSGDLVEQEREGARVFRLEPVVLAILLFMLAFIAFIAWRITLMEPPAK